MALPKFIVNATDIKQGEVSHLSVDESHHAIRVRRLKQGQSVILLDGKGLVAKGELADMNKRALGVLVQTVEFVPQQKPCLSVAVAMPKPDKIKLLIDMLVQLGVSEVIPLKCKHSVTLWTEKLADKSAKIMLEACKQSENPWLPSLSPQLTVQEAVEKAKAQESCDLYFGHLLDESQTITKSQTASKLITNQPKNMTLLIGPEAGFSETELNYLLNDVELGKITPLQVGKHILRTETAAVAASAVLLNSLNR